MVLNSLFEFFCCWIWEVHLVRWCNRPNFHTQRQLLRKNTPHLTHSSDLLMHEINFFFFFKYQSKNPEIAFTGLSLSSHGHFLALSPVSFPVPASKHKHLSPVLVQQSHIFLIQMFNLSRCCGNEVDTKYMARINNFIYSSLSRSLLYIET